MTIRKAIIEDLPALTAIYNQAIKARQTADTIPVTTADRKAWFDSHQIEQYPLFVAIDEDAILGYATLSQYRGGRAALSKVVEISYYIHQDHQRKGLGTLLLDYAMKAAQNLGFQHAFALLLDTNLPSVKLLEKFGFIQWGHFPNIAEIDGEICGQFYYGKHLVQLAVSQSAVCSRARN
ncbi:MAG: N-acetyltransferase family protein [Bacteroidota bacterium]